jgi:hypothetical protein
VALPKSAVDTIATSPTATSATEISNSPSGRSIRALSGRSDISARIAAVVDRFARNSIHLPHSAGVTTWQ